MSAPFHLLPSIHELVQALLAEGVPRGLALEAARSEVEFARQEMIAGGDLVEDLTERALCRARSLSSRRLVPVINGTGVVLHTNLGRAPLAPEVMASVAAVGAYSNLEIRLDSGERGGRLDGIAEHLCALCGTEAAIAVNNNAAAVLLTLTALARDQEVLVSRGELVEIGGSFRVPDVISAGGARLVEVGTTNRTRVSDFEAAITEDSALILRVHPSNFKISGFTERPRRVGLVDLGRRFGLPVVEDLGSGLLEPLGPGGGPVVREVMESGVDLACFSGDKLLGGPQAGLIVGRQDLVGRLRKHPLYRALRLDKLGLAALEATLVMYREGRADQVPLRQMILATPEECRERADRMARAIDGAVVEEGEGLPGGGALPGKALAGAVVVLRHRGLSALAQRLRQGDPSVLLRVSKDALIIDPRTVLVEQEASLIEALKAAVAAIEPVG
jgi:L-seryl-tRNA(Ser) seleniumtransferase